MTVHAWSRLVFKLIEAAADGLQLTVCPSTGRLITVISTGPTASPPRSSRSPLVGQRRGYGRGGALGARRFRLGRHASRVKQVPFQPSRPNRVQKINGLRASGPRNPAQTARNVKFADTPGPAESPLRPGSRFHGSRIIARAALPSSAFRRASLAGDCPYDRAAQTAQTAPKSAASGSRRR